MGEAGGKGEKTRLCPSCRMEISVLATKCRFCGEAVGRPRDETRSLSIDDLGGETIRHYAPSSSVMEAMEAFRSEHEFKSNPPEDVGPERKSLFGISQKKKADTGRPVGADGLPQLDERSQALASLAMPSVKPTAHKKPKGPSMTTRLIQVIGILLGIVVLIVAASSAYRYINRPKVEPPRTKANPAEGMLARGDDPTQAVVAAAQALREEEHSKNHEILKNAEAKFAEKIHALLNASPWKQQDLRDASRNVDEAFKADSSPNIRKLKEEVDAETFAYQMSLLSVADGANEATVGLSQAAAGSGERTVKVKVGDSIAGRFKVTAIKRDKLQVVDTQRKDRPLTYHLNESLITSP